MGFSTQLMIFAGINCRSPEIDRRGCQGDDAAVPMSTFRLGAWSPARRLVLVQDARASGEIGAASVGHRFGECGCQPCGCRRCGVVRPPQPTFVRLDRMSPQREQGNQMIEPLHHHRLGLQKEGRRGDQLSRCGSYKLLTM
jgi:hypothetical protein